MTTRHDRDRTRTRTWRWALGAWAIALAAAPAIAHAQDGGGGQVVPPEWWIRMLVGALGGAVSWAQAMGAPADPAAPPTDAATRGLRALIAVILGAAAGFVVIAAPVLAGSQEAWLAWSLVAGFSGSGLLGALTARLEATATARRLADNQRTVAEAARLLDVQDPEAVQQARVLLASVPK